MDGRKLRALARLAQSLREAGVIRYRDEECEFELAPAVAAAPGVHEQPPPPVVDAATRRWVSAVTTYRDSGQ